MNLWLINIKTIKTDKKLDFVNNFETKNTDNIEMKTVNDCQNI